MVEPVSLQTLLTYLTLISVPVGVFYHIMTLRNTRRNQELTLETRQAQLYNNIWNQSLNNPHFQRLYMRYSSLQWSSVEEFMETFPFNDYESENTMTLWGIALFFEGLAPLVKEGLLDIKYLDGTIGALLGGYWMKLEPFADEIRERWNSPGLFEQAEYLHNELHK
jgi:hypothetical protein